MSWAEEVPGTSYYWLAKGSGVFLDLEQLRRNGRAVHCSLCNWAARPGQVTGRGCQRRFTMRM